MKHLTAKTTIHELVTSKVFALLAPHELSVYLRLVEASATLGRKFVISNAQLGHHPATIRATLKRMEMLDIVRVTHDSHPNGVPRRTVELR
jgi:hypothetical protein